MASDQELHAPTFGRVPWAETEDRLKLLNNGSVPREFDVQRMSASVSPA